MAAIKARQERVRALYYNGRQLNKAGQDARHLPEQHPELAWYRGLNIDWEEIWRQQERRKTPGTAVIEFLPALDPTLSKSAFLDLLTETVETQTAELVAEATGKPAMLATLIPDPPKGMEA